MDSLIAFVHIPKTAGGTVRSMLAAAYSRPALHGAGNYLSNPEKAVRKISRRPGGWERWQRKGGRVTVGHVPYGVFRERLPAGTRYLTFLREPVDRVLSTYYGHMHRPDLSDAGSSEREQVRKVICDSLEEALVDKRLPEVNNLATRFLCRSPQLLAELPAGALEEAKANLREFAFVGVQERFEESIVLLKRTLGLGLVPYVDRNVRSGRPMVAEIPDEQRALIEECNRLDTELYAFGRGLLENAVEAAGEGLAGYVEALRA